MNENRFSTVDASGRAMQAAMTRIQRAQTKLWGDWMIVGDGLMEGRRWAMRVAGTNRPEGKGYVLAFAEYLERYNAGDKRLHPSDRAKLLQLMEERPAIEQWRKELDPHTRSRLNHPTTVWRKWKADTRVKPTRKPGFSANEMTRARVTVEQLQARNTELEEELTAAQERIKELEQELASARAVN